MRSIDKFLSEVYTEELYQVSEAEYDEVMRLAAEDDFSGYEEFSQEVEASFFTEGDVENFVFIDPKAEPTLSQPIRLATLAITAIKVTFDVGAKSAGNFQRSQERGHSISNTFEVIRPMSLTDLITLPTTHINRAGQRDWLSALSLSDGENTMAFYDYHKYEAKLTQREINAYEDWKASRFPEHVHGCAECGNWIKDCHTFHCEDSSKPILCAECKEKAAA